MFVATKAITQILKLKKRIRAVPGSASAGKTIGIIAVLIDLAQRDEKPILTSIVSESFPHLKRGAMRDFLNIMNEQKYYKDGRWNRTDYIYSFETGSKIEFFSADQPDKVRGPRRQRLFINEANNVPFETFEQLEIRTSDIIYLDWNPVSEFWYYTEIKGKRDDVDELTLTYKDNEALPLSVVKSIESRKDRRNWWRVFGLGLLGEAEGRIYKEWQIIDEIPHEARLECYGLDFGYSLGQTAITAIYYYDGGYILDEITYQKGLSNKEIANILKNQEAKIVIADSAEPKSIDEIKTYGINILPSVKGKDSVKYGISLVQDKRISVTKQSVNLIKEYRNYLWQRDKKTGKIINEPEKGLDHCFAPDTLIYTTKGKIKIKDLIGKEGYLFTRDNQIKRFHNVRITRKNTEILNIEFIDGNVLSVTPDHLLLLPNGKWIPASLLCPQDMIQSVIYESKDYFIKKAKIQWQGVLFLWKVFFKFFFKRKAFTSGSMDISQWGNTKRVSYSSQRFQSEKQSDRKFRTIKCEYSYEKTYDACKKSESKKMDRENPAFDEKMAFVGRRKRVAQITRDRSICQKKTSREKLRSLPYEIFNYAIRQISKILLSKLQDESQTKTIERITGGCSALTYNLEVEDTHCLLANGVIAHNCLDGLRYGIVYLNPKTPEEDIREEARIRQQRSLLEKVKRDDFGL